MSVSSHRGSLLGSNVLQNVTVSNLNITSDPTSGTSAVNRQYVDTLMESVSNGVIVKAPVRLATVANLSATYNQPNADDGLGATLTGTGVGALSIDGVTVNTNDRVLVKNQTSTTQNGIYTVTTVGNGSTAFVLTRATDADNASPSNELKPGSLVFANEGNTNSNYAFIITSPSTGDIVIGTTGIVWSQYRSNLYSAGSNLTLTGSTFAVSNTLSGLTSVSAGSATLATPLSIASGGTNASTAEEARTTLGLGTISTLNSVDLTANVTNALPIANGGTNATTASDARTNLGLGTLATGNVPSSGYVKSNGTALSSVSTVPLADVSGAGTLAATNIPSAGIVTSTGSAISSFATPSAGIVTSNGSTLSSFATPSSGLVTSNGTTLSSVTFPSSGLVTSNGTALSNISIPASGYVTSNGTTLSSTASIPASDITGLGGYMVGSNNLSELSNASTARTNLGLGSIATQNSSNVTISGGTASGLTSVGAGEVSTTAGTSGGGVLHHKIQNSGLRFGVGLAGSESGSNAGSNYTIFRYDDAASYLGTPLTLQRSTGYLGLGTTTPARPLSVVDSGFMQVNFGQANDKGGYLHSSADSQALIVGGARYDGGWVAKATSSSHIDMVNGSIAFNCNTGLTAGNSFTPTGRLTISPTSATFTVPPVYSSNYMVGARHRDGLRIIAGQVDMSDPTGPQSGDGWALGSTGSNAVGSIFIGWTVNFTTLVSVTVTPVYNNDAGNLGVCAYVRTNPALDYSGVRIQTVNTGTGALIGVDGTAAKIKVFFTAIGY